MGFFDLTRGNFKQLRDGFRPSTEIVDLAKAQGISEHTLDRARKELNVVSRRTGYQGRVMIGLPDAQSERTDKTDLASNDDLPLAPATGHPSIGPGADGAVTGPAMGANTLPLSNADDWEERAAIAEYEGGLSRKASELLAGPPPTPPVTEAA